MKATLVVGEDGSVTLPEDLCERVGLREGTRATLEATEDGILIRPASHLTTHDSKLGIEGAVIAFDITGTGQPLLLIHAGIADRRMWDDQMEPFAERYRVIRCDLPGVGESRLPESGPFAMRTTIARFLEEVDATPAIVLGCSFGARVALELAVDRPELVSALVLVCPGIAGHAWSEAIALAEQEIERALAAGDLDAAAEVDVHVWVDGPTRTPTEVDPAVRQRALAMARGIYEIVTSQPEPDLEPIPLDPPVADRLGTITVPTLIITGTLDQTDTQVIAERLAAGIPNARTVEMPGVAHLPNMEQPDTFNEIVLGFLREMGQRGDVEAR